MLTFATVVTVLAVLRWLPHGLARSLGARLAGFVFRLAPGWQSYAATNLRLAFPGLTTAERAQILQSAVRHWGWQLAEFARFPCYTRENIGQVIEYDGLENYQQAVAQGKGVLYLTAHLGAWELSSFMHSVNGDPLTYLNRPIDNPYLDDFYNDMERWAFHLQVFFLSKRFEIHRQMVNSNAPCA